MGIEDFLEQIDEDLDEGVLSPRAFSDPELHRLEMERIFTRCWVFVAHESEIPNPGDYVLRHIGEDRFIVARDEGGQIRVLLNHCPHRGALVCRADKGNSSHFRCPYHGWIFKNTGDWNGAPSRPKAYRKLDAERFGLAAAPHVDSYQGLVFACLDPEAGSLRDYLGDMCWYLDLILGLNGEGMRTYGDPHRWIVDANWKSGADNFVGDGYHVPHLHRSTEEAGIFPDIDKAINVQFHVDFDNGHGMIINRGNLPKPPWGIFDYPQEVVDTFELDRLDENQLAFVESYGVTTFTIFPNLSFLRAPGVTDPTSEMPANYTLLKQWQPHGHDQVEVWNWSLAWNAASPEFNDASYKGGISNFGASGTLEQDDSVVFGGPPLAARSPFAARALKLNYQLGHEGMSDYDEVEDWVGPGRASTTIFGEKNQRTFWRRWTKELRNR